MLTVRANTFMPDRMGPCRLRTACWDCWSLISTCQSTMRMQTACQPRMFVTPLCCHQPFQHHRHSEIKSAVQAERNQEPTLQCRQFCALICRRVRPCSSFWYSYTPVCNCLKV